MRALIVMITLTGIASAICFGIAALSPSHVDENGMLVEPFAWMASGKILMILFVVGSITGLLISLFRRILRARGSRTPDIFID